MAQAAAAAVAVAAPAAVLRQPPPLNRSQDPNLSLDERIKILYPMVDENVTPLPRCWSTKDKYNYIGLSQNNLRVKYNGHGKTHKDASSVRATQAVPASCGIYYFEVKIVSKGRDGYMGVGLSAQGVNMNRLPGWDKHSYGYHGDDGHSFCSSGTGQAYGPTFTTGDVIGCGINLIDGSCFYTKNGHHLGIAFTDLPPNLYPTVGLQTPGEVVDANFGQDPFLFDIEGEMWEYRTRIHSLIENFPSPGKHGDWQTVLQRMVSSYLVHHGYCAAAEAFSKSTGQEIAEDLTSMKHRQTIQKFVLSGRMGEAIQMTDKLYPGLLSLQPSLHFLLKVRQFIEMVSGSDSVEFSNGCSNAPASPSPPPSHAAMAVSAAGPSSSASMSASPGPIGPPTPPEVPVHPPPPPPQQYEEPAQLIASAADDSSNSNLTGASEDGILGHDMLTNGGSPLPAAAPSSLAVTNGNGGGSAEVNANNGDAIGDETATDDNMDVDDESGSAENITNHNNHHQQQQPQPRSVVSSNPVRFERLIQFGRSLQLMHADIEQQKGKNDANTKMLQDAFSLLAYADPWQSPLGWQLQPAEREAVCGALNSAILQAKQLPSKPPLEITYNHAQSLLQLMAHNGLGACAFANIEDIIR